MAPLLVTIFFGVLLSALPHLLAWIKTGAPVWIADTDELELYLKTASKAYFNHPWFISDPVFADSTKPTVYPWLQFFPATMIAYILNLGPMSISIVWRVLAGALVAWGWYLLFHQYWKDTKYEPWAGWMAAAVSILLLGETA